MGTPAMAQRGKEVANPRNLRAPANQDSSIRSLVFMHGRGAITATVMAAADARCVDSGDGVLAQASPPPLAKVAPTTVAEAAHVFDTMDRVFAGDWEQLPLFACQTMDYLSTDVSAQATPREVAYEIGVKASHLVRYIMESATREREAQLAHDAAAAPVDEPVRLLASRAPSRRDVLWLLVGMASAMHAMTLQCMLAFALRRLAARAPKLLDWGMPVVVAAVMGSHVEPRLAPIVPAVVGWGLAGQYAA